MLFSEMRFGFASAETEGTRDPVLLTDGYLDPANLVSEALSGYRFVFLGNKGSGKSAIAQHLALKNSKYSSFITSIYLAEFPYRDLDSLCGSGGADRFTGVWGSLLLLLFLESFANDNGATHADPDRFESALALLQEVGFLPHSDFTDAIERTRKVAVKFGLPGFEGSFESLGKRQPQSPPAGPFLFQKLRAIATGFHSSSKHILFVDGLDDAFLSGASVFESIAALIRDADRLNSAFRDAHVPAKVIVLCRTELFDRLPGSNNNKIRQDSSIQINWYHDPREPLRASLIRLANLRASISASAEVDLFKSIFPAVIANRPTAQFLLDHTRHTPRDFLQLLKHMQYFAGRGIGLSEDAIFSGLASFSRDYFLPEIMDELDKYIDRDIVENLFTAFRRLRKRRFTAREIESACEDIGGLRRQTVHSVLTAMFDCSSLGTFVEVLWSGRTELRYTFRFRNRGAELNLDEGLILHRGLWKALNLVAEGS